MFEGVGAVVVGQASSSGKLRMERKSRMISSSCFGEWAIGESRFAPDSIVGEALVLQISQPDCMDSFAIGQRRTY